MRSGVVMLGKPRRLEGGRVGERYQVISRVMRRKPMIICELIMVMTGSTTGPKREWRGSNRPQLLSCFWATEVLELLSTNEPFGVSASPFLLLPLDLTFAPNVFVRDLDARPCLRAFTRSLA